MVDAMEIENEFNAQDSHPRQQIRREIQAILVGHFTDAMDRNPSIHFSKPTYPFLGVFRKLDNLFDLSRDTSGWLGCSVERRMDGMKVGGGRIRCGVFPVNPMRLRSHDSFDLLGSDIR